MKTIIKHIFGNIDEYDLQVYKLSLDLQGEPEYKALEQGWSVQYGNWYPSRMVRLDLSRYNKTPKQIKNYTFTHHDNPEDYSEFERVFEEFVVARDFTPQYKIATDLDRTSWLSVHKEDRLVAFTKFINYDGGLESQFTAWDYSEPKLSIGVKIVDYEVEVARSKGLDYLYIGPGYGKSCFYKSKFQGFEWWTGTEWCGDIQAYQEICMRDSTINTFDDLSKLIWDH